MQTPTGGDPFRRVNAGDPLSISAVAWNAHNEVYDAYRRSQGFIGVDLSPANLSPVTVLVQNQSGQDLERFACLGLGGPVIHPNNNERAFTNRPVFLAGGAATNILGRIAITQRPIKAGRFGPAVVRGITACKIKGLFTNRADRARDGSLSYLEPVREGGAIVLWQAGGAGTTHWALVNLGSPDEPVGGSGAVGTGPDQFGMWTITVDNKDPVTGIDPGQGVISAHHVGGPGPTLGKKAMFFWNTFKRCWSFIQVEC